ncbi:drug resistance transporter, EmrB/QacA subfamily [Pedococcus cremeus]|uniref:Drug resistance transporter, EmrB/QacA subfamily n=1 Tax=Pedococcus cremeus TaxID=587636 RepID=A0A1H9UPT3_9MICO|nr:MFS transporter [Pedococcus cremeus]SES11540.1 drug resistance transporter, EmrB/QacA subfamily [Pedococcus cremeus]
MTTTATSTRAPAAPAATQATGPAHPRAILAVILVSYFLILLDNSVIFTGLPSIAAALRLDATGLSWVQDAYTLVFGGLLLLGARLGDLLGRRRVFVAGLAVFVTASFLVGVAPTGWWLIAARAVQGVGAAVVAPSALSLLTASFPAGPQRSRAVAWYAATAGIGASLGLLVGGAAAQWVSWRAGFFINVPLGIAMAVLAPRYLPAVERQRGRFDVTGAAAATLAVAALVFGVLESVDRGWASPVVLVALAGSAVLFVVLVLHERRAEQPIMPLHLFADRRRWGAYAARALYLGAMMGFFFFTTQLMQGVLGFTAFQAGLGFLPMTAVNFAVATAVPRLTARVGDATMLVAGVVLTLAGMAWLAQVDQSSSYATAVALPMVLIGAGQGLAFAPLTSFGIAGAHAADAGAASGLVNTAHQLGTAAGLAVLVAASSSAVDLTGRVSTALSWGTGLLVACLVVAVAVIVPAERRSRA